MPEKRNKTAVCIKKDSLSVAIRTENGSVLGDIFTLVMEIKNISFGKANKFIHKILGLKYEFKTKKSKEDIEKKDPLQIFKKVKRHKHIVNKDIPVYDNGCLKEYIKLPHINWVREGIMPFACEKFNIGYSYDRKRIVIPERKWDGDDNEYIGIGGRTTIENYELLDIPKYFKLSDTYPKGNNIYGLNENYKTIQETGYVVVFESQKSVLKRYSRKDGTGTAIGNCEITDEQIKILLSLNVDIILCFDEGIDINHIRKECDKFYPIRNVYYIYDRWGLMNKGSKDSPADLEDKKYRFMLKHKVKYDANERKLYKDWQEKQKKN